MGRSCTMMKSVPSPGSPSHIPSKTFSRCSCAFSLCASTFACNCAKRLLIPCSLWGSSDAAVALSSGITSSSSGIAISSSVSEVSADFSSSAFCSFFSSSCEVGASSCSVAAFSLFLASIIAKSSSSLFVFLPRCLGMAANSSSGESAGVSSSAGASSSNWSLNREIGSLTGLFFFRSKFSPSLPFTEYTLSISCFAMRTLLRFVPVEALLSSSAFCFSSMVSMSCSGVCVASRFAPNSCAISVNSRTSLDDNSSLLYILV